MTRRPRLINFVAGFNRTLPWKVDFELRITSARSTPKVREFGRDLVDPGRLERPTNSLGNCCSIHLSYGSTRGGKRPEGSRKVHLVQSFCWRRNGRRRIFRSSHPLHRDMWEPRSRWMTAAVIANAETEALLTLSTCVKGLRAADRRNNGLRR